MNKPRAQLTLAPPCLNDIPVRPALLVLTTLLLTTTLPADVGTGAPSEALTQRFVNAYFRNGFSSDNTFQDLLTGEEIQLEASSGWGPAWTAGMRYEFQPSRRDRLLGEVQFTSMDRDGTPLRFFAIRFGYRAL